MRYDVVAVIPAGAEKGGDRVEEWVLFCRVLSHVGVLDGGRAVRWSLFLVERGRVGRIMTGYWFGGRGARAPCVDQARSFISWCDRLYNVSPGFLLKRRKCVG